MAQNLVNLGWGVNNPFDLNSGAYGLLMPHKAVFPSPLLVSIETSIFGEKDPKMLSQ